MNNFKGMLVCFLLVALSISVMKVKGDTADELQKAWDSMGPVERNALEALAAPFNESILDSIKSISKCMEDNLKGLNLCDFDFSYDPYYIIQTCLKGTILQKIIEGIVKNIPVAEFPFGIPNEISKERCFTSMPSLTTIPSISSISPAVTSFPGIGK